MSLRHSRPRTLAAAGSLVALGLFLTACGGDDSAAAPESSASSESGASSGSEGATPPGASADPGAESDAGADGSPEEGGQEEGAPEGGSKNGSEEGSVRTFTGVLSYLAPGELMVGDRSFLVAEDTVTMGGDICGDPENPGTEECTPEELEMAAKSGNLTIEVAVDANGIAERIQQT